MARAANRVTPAQKTAATGEINSTLRANKKLSDLSDVALLVVISRCHAELLNRDSPYSSRGLNEADRLLR